MLGRDPCRWQIGSPATARPLGKKPLTSSKRPQATRKLQRRLSQPRLGLASVIWLPIYAAQTHREQPQPRPHVRVVPGAAQPLHAPPAARAHRKASQADKASHGGLRRH